jgi:pSer/pThr/pTyr-binding forkhead associated (FHA) protein
METVQSNPEQEDGNREIGFLVVDGSMVITIDKPIINIGRKSDNHIVINDEHISRYHAQIRMTKGQYILLDLNSTVGTSVNGERIEQVSLNPGDVISLGGVPIIFGLGNPTEGTESLRPTNIGDSAPTDKTEINSADNYLSFFNIIED